MSPASWIAPFLLALSVLMIPEVCDGRVQEYIQATADRVLPDLDPRSSSAPSLHEYGIEGGRA